MELGDEPSHFLVFLPPEQKITHTKVTAKSLNARSGQGSSVKREGGPCRSCEKAGGGLPEPQPARL